MNALRRRMMVLAATAGLAAAWGCSGGAPAVDTSTAEATVSGKVSFSGKTATKGTVVFDPSNYKRKDASPRSAEIGADGSYTVTTLVGQNQVSVNSPELKNSDYPPIEFDVQSGDNTFDIEVTPATAK